MSKIIKKYLLLTIIFIAGCASPAPPSGGPPDKTPPVILDVKPVNGTINFKDKEISFRFSKYMEKNSVIENTTISPTRKLEFDWSGKELTIEIAEPLDTNTTYALTLGTDYQDTKGNKPEQAYTVTFSTGPKLDSGKIYGFLNADNPAGVYIYAFSLAKINPDTLNPTHTKPQYKIQVGTSGKFEFMALKEGKYRLYAIRDQYKDDIYDEGIDAFGAAAQDAEVKKDTNPEIRLRIGPVVDKVGPALFDVEAISNRKITANFSELLDTASANRDAFEITDSASGKSVEIADASLNSKSGNKIDIYTKSPLDTTKNWKLTVLNDTNHAIRDTSGNIIQDTARMAIFLAISEKDTTDLKLLKSPFADSSKNITLSPMLDFYFNTVVDKKSFDERISFLNSKSEPVEHDVLWRTGTLLRIVPGNKLLPDTWYELILNLDSLSNITGYKISKDTTIHLRFKTIDTRTYGAASGFFRDSLSLCRNPLVSMISKETRQRYITQPGDSGKWEFKELPPGNYFFEVICDLNKDGKYNYGKAFPFEPSEPYAIFPKEINIKPRWKVENIILRFIN